MVGNNNLIEQLQRRGLVVQVTDKKALEEKLSHKSITLYCGFDPTADSLHLGHLVPLLCLKFFQQMGHKPIALVGGATGLIGDPSFKNNERKLLSIKNVQTWVEKIRKQIMLFLNFDCGETSAKIVNNYDWFSKMDCLTFLRDIGRHFSINRMVSKEAVKQRLDRDEFGISFTEFTYNLLQSYDFAKLNYENDVELQIGGSDQWGNITSGIDLIRRLYQKQVFGLTVPLLTRSDGTKFGKTESGVIWLDPQKTSPYQFYQFWVNIADADVYRFLKIFTFMSVDEIEALQKSELSCNNRSNSIAKYKYVLAEKVTQLVHGDNGVKVAKRITDILFYNSIDALKISDFDQLIKTGSGSIPIIKLKLGANLQQALVASKLVPSRGQAKTLIISNAVMINGNKCVDDRYIFTAKDLLFGRYSLIKRGKKKYCLIDWQQ